MRLVTFIHQNETHLGALTSRDQREFVLDFHRAQPRLTTDLTEFLRGGDALLSWAKDAVAISDARRQLALSNVTLLPPVSRPGKIICIGHNYRDHTGATPPNYPDLFAKFSTVLLAAHQPIILPRASQAVDYEAELAVVIGKRARHVNESDALDYVAGYTIFNDVTARDYQKRQLQWSIGKSFDTFGPIGPALVTADEISDPGNLDLTLWVNSEPRQHSNTRNLIFSVPFLMAYLSEAMTLEPGDLIATGTPSGTGVSLKPPIFLKAGDTVRIEIEKIGELINPVRAEIF